MPHERPLPGLLPPVTPGDYLRLRRQAAGLTIEQAARAFWTRPQHRTDVEANLRAHEQPGVVVKPHLVVELQRAFPVDADVYRQLAEEPPHLHPAICPTCACSTWTPCELEDGSECRHGDDGAPCTACQEKAAARQTRKAA